MKKKVAFTVIGLLILLGTLGGIKGLQIGKMIAQGKQFVPPPDVVTTAVVRTDSWETLLTAVGTLEAVQGVTVSTEMSGRVAAISFEPGSKVQKGDLLVQLDTSSENARLRSAEASLSLAATDLARKKALIAGKSISRAEFDNAEARYKQAMAEVDNIQSIIDKKTIRAPFAGRLGIRLVNLGQILNEGEAIVSLQALDPIFVNFSLPQQQLALVKTGLMARMNADSLPGEVVEGKITAINPEVDVKTRNVRVQATVPNPKEQLRPGMFVNVSVVLPAREEVLTIPATAVLYAPYSDSVFVVEETKPDNAEKPVQTVRQQFVRLGAKNGDFVVVVSGLESGQKIVSTGVFKLRNGQTIVEDNTLSPQFHLAPSPEDS